jgi:hypothetical protein
MYVKNKIRKKPHGFKALAKIWIQNLKANVVASNLDAKLAVLRVLKCNEHSKLLTYASEPNSKYLQQNIGKKRGYDAGDAFPPFIKITMVCANMRCQNQMKKSQRGLNLKSASSTFPHFISFHLALNFIDIACGHGLYTSLYHPL